MHWQRRITCLQRSLQNLYIIQSQLHQGLGILFKNHLKWMETPTIFELICTEIVFDIFK